MSLRDKYQKEHPDFPWLDPADAQAIQSFMAERGWLDPDERVTRCSAAGAGNMNLTMKVETSERALVMKQARPWVEAHPEIEAPWDRLLQEQRYYARVSGIPGVVTRSPEILGFDPDSKTMIMEFLPGAADLSPIYGGESLSDDELDQLGRYLVALHTQTRGDRGGRFRNEEMFTLNHHHIFEVPLDPANGLDLEQYESGLQDKAKAIQNDAALKEKAKVLGDSYRESDTCLIHGDFYPGSWLRTDKGVYIIDPEFSSFSDPEFDIGVAIAHFAMAQMPIPRIREFFTTYRSRAEAFDLSLEKVAGYTGFEIIRRLIGVAQLPIPESAGLRSTLLDTGRAVALEGALQPLLEG